MQPLVGPFFTVWGASQILLYGVATLALRKAWGGTAGRRRILAWLRAVAVAFAAVCASTFLANTIPWWRAGDSTASHLLAVTGAVAVYVVVITALALLGRGDGTRSGRWGSSVRGGGRAGRRLRHRLAAHDVEPERPATGRRRSLLRHGQPAVRPLLGRALLFTVAVADWLVRSGRRRAAVVLVAVVGLLATYVDGVLGADFGGPPAILPAFGLLALVVAGVKVTPKRVVVLLGATLLVLAAISVADWLRPVDDQTHLGRFVQTVVDGGAWQVIERKGEQNLRILFSNWILSLVLALATVFIAVVLAARGSWASRCSNAPTSATPS